MTRFNEDTYIEYLPISIYKELVDALNKDAAWMTLANHVAEYLEYPCTLWIQSLKEKKDPHDSPGQKLLFELNIKMCTVEILRILLNDCGLLNILSIISDPEPLRIIKHPTEDLQNEVLEISFGHHLHLYCKAVGMPPPSYTWYHSSNQLENYTSSELDLIITSASQAGEYKCKVLQFKNDGTLLSTLIAEPVIVQISSLPVAIEEQPQPILEVKEGDSFTIHCKANGHPEPHYQWFHGNTKLEGQTSNVLHIKKFNSKYKGKYYCYVCNNVSEAYTERTHVMMDLPRMKAVAKVALIIANEKYEHHKCLLTPGNDAARIGNILKDIGFEVICLINLTMSQMKNAIKLFSKFLVEGVYGLFYFAGHGFKMQESYMLATDAPEIYLRTNAICESELLAAFLENDPKLLIIILDMCQTLPSKEFNPDIHNEVPTVNEYKSKNNLRNLIQAYSTSSYRPSYERKPNKYGLYMKHLSKYINKDIPVTELFQEVEKSTNSCFENKERNQIPMHASSVTEPFRLTDAVYIENPPNPINYLKKLLLFSTRALDIIFKEANIHTTATISLFLKPCLNLLKISLSDLQGLEVNFLNSISTKRNKLYQDQRKKECVIHNPQINERLIVSLHKDDVLIGATELHMKDCIPPLLEFINF